MNLRRFLLIVLPLGAVILVNIIFLLKKKEAPSNVKLVIYTYSSFTNAWGASPELSKAFKEQFNVDLDFVDVGEAGLLLQRLQFEKNNTKADIVLGLDQYSMGDVKSRQLENIFEPIQIKMDLDPAAPVNEVQKKYFVAYNWAPMRFIYRKSDKINKPKKLIEFISEKNQFKMILLDPRTSTPGYIFFHWIVQKLGASGAIDFVHKIRSKIFTVTASWSSGYGLFKDRQAHYIFSYATSPAFHWNEEKNFDYQPLELEDPTPFHIEYAAILNSSSQKELSKKFIEFLLSPAAQKIIMEKNYMLPITNGVRVGTVFENIGSGNLFYPTKNILKDKIFEIWKSIKW